MTAERDRRAVIAKSEGVQGSKINDAEGIKAEMVNISEAEMQRQINEAEGLANEIESIAEATAISIEKIAHALSQPMGADAMKLRLSEKYLNTLEGLGQDKNDIILPKEDSKLMYTSSRIFEALMAFLNAPDIKTNLAIRLIDCMSSCLIKPEISIFKN